MLDLDTVQYNIERWVETFVEVPNPALGGWSPCPYARQARLNNEYDIRLGTDPYLDAMNVGIASIKRWETGMIQTKSMDHALRIQLQFLF